MQGTVRGIDMGVKGLVSLFGTSGLGMTWDLKVPKRTGRSFREALERGRLRSEGEEEIIESESSDSGDEGWLPLFSSVSMSASISTLLQLSSSESSAKVLPLTIIGIGIGIGMIS